MFNDKLTVLVLNAVTQQWDFYADIDPSYTDDVIDVVSEEVDRINGTLLAFEIWAPCHTQVVFSYPTFH